MQQKVVCVFVVGKNANVNNNSGKIMNIIVTPAYLKSSKID